MALGILADENIPAVEHYLGSTGEVKRVPGRDLRREQLKGVDALLVRSVTRVDEELLHGSGVKFVGSATSGVDHIDREYLARKGIGFAHAPGSNANSVVEYVLAAIAAVAGKLEQLLDGGIVGIVGYGLIGKALAQRLQALGIRYRVYDPWLEPEKVSHPLSLTRVLSSDVVSLHAELTMQQPWPSFHLLNETGLGGIAGDALLINASRGPVVDNVALRDLLCAGRGPATVLDVWEGEPDIDAALLDQVTLGTAHIAGYSLDGKISATRMLGQAMAAYFGGQEPPRDSPVPDAPALVAPPALYGAQLVRFLLCSRYDILRDDALLRGVMNVGGTAIATGAFDRLRKEYGERRELRGATIRAGACSPQDIALIRGLGCVPVVTGALE